MDQLSMFKEKFKVEELLIYESEYWTWSLRPLQPTLGSGVLAMKRYAQAFSDINEDEGKDLSVIVKIIENSLSEVFKYEKINYLMLMMVDPHVHFHIIPRYSVDKDFKGVKWSDKGWPGPPSLEAEELDDKVLESIRMVLKEHIE